MGTSIACNFIPFAADVTCMLPKYLNIVRGQILCLVLAFAIVPWRIIATANGFLNFLGGYSIFRGPVVAIMIVDYLIVRRDNLDLPSLFTLASASRYHDFHGFNVRAFAAFIVGFMLPLPGFVGSFGRDVGAAATHMYEVGWVLSSLIGALAYYVVCILFRVPEDDDRHAFEERVGASQGALTDAFDVGESEETDEAKRTNDSEKASRVTTDLTV